MSRTTEVAASVGSASRRTFAAAATASLLAIAAVAPASAASGWVAPVDIPVGGPGTVSSNQVAFDGQGDAIVVGEGYDEEDDSLIRGWVRPVASGVWQAPVDLSAAVPEEQLDPRVAVDPQGTAIAVWEHPEGPDGSDWVVQASVRPADGGVWQSPVDLSAPGPEPKHQGERRLDPQIAVDSQGNAIAIWRQFSGKEGEFEIQSSVRPASSGAWQAPVEIGLVRGGESLSLAADPQGDAVAVWEGAGIQAAVRPAVSGVWQAPVSISAKGVDGESPHAAMDAQGDAVAVWVDQTKHTYPGSEEVERIVQASVRPSASGVWEAPVDLSPHNAVATNEYGNPEIAVDAQGDAVAVWTTASFLVQATVRPAASAVWRAPVAISASGQESFSPEVAVDPQGEAIASWQARYDCPPCTWLIQSAVRPAGDSSAWQAPVDVSAPLGEVDSDSLAFDQQGNAIAVWGAFLPGEGGEPVLQAAYYERPSEPPEYGRCLKVPAEKEGTKSVHHGGFTTATCTVASEAGTGKYEWYPGILRSHFTTTLKKAGAADLETASGTKVTCEGESASGEDSATKQVASVIVSFSGCESSGQKCTTPGLAEGDLETKTLEGTLGWETESSKKVALDLYPVGRTGPFLEYRCVGGAPVTVTGSVLVPVKADKMDLTSALKYVARKGRQKPEHLEGEANDVLTASLNGEVFEPVGVTSTVTLVSEEALEINAVV